MRGGFVHREGLLAPAAALFQGLGATVMWEHPAGKGRNAGYVDLLILYCWLRIVVEAELSSRRVENDLRKARSLAADLLVFLAPTHRVGNSIRRRLGVIHKPEHPPTPRIWILTPGLLPQYVANLGQKGLLPNVLLSSVPKTPSLHEN